METDTLQPPEQFEFPFPPYSIQHDFMKNLYDTIEQRKLGIFESPTGTGKSLSIICGALRWLKDHNTHERHKLDSGLNCLEAEKQRLAAESTDWLVSQSKEIEVTRKMNELRIEQKKISDYDKKIEQLKKKNTKVKQNKWSKMSSERIEKTEDLLAVEEKIADEPEDNVLLEESEQNVDDESDDEKDDDVYKPTKIFICSRTHSQLSQFVGEISKSPFANDVRVVSLASRQTYCINPAVSKLKNMSLINERCLDMQRKKDRQNRQTDENGKVVKRQKNSDTNAKCPFYKQSAIDELKDTILTEVQDVEDLLKDSKQLKACPYYASRLAVEDAEIVLVPYNTILHKATRDANGINLKNNVVIVDEAHNLLEAMAQMYNAELSSQQLNESRKQLESYQKRYSTRFSPQNYLFLNQLIFVLQKLHQMLDSGNNGTKNKEPKTDIYTVENFVTTAQIDKYNMFRLVKFCKDSRVAQKVRGHVLSAPLVPDEPPKKLGLNGFLNSMKPSTTKQKQQPTLTEQPTVEKSPSSTGALMTVINFLECLTYTYSDGRIFVHLIPEDPTKSKLQFLLLNPSKNFTDIVTEARSVIVAGGTMKPMAEFKNRLFITSGADPGRIVEFSCDHIIPAENILPIVLTKGPKKESLLFNFENRMSMGPSVKSMLQDCCKKVRGGIVVFFPSYKYENWVWQQIKDSSLGRAVFREPQDSGSVDNVLKAYAAEIAKPHGRGALLLSVVGGKLSEGLNFSDDLGRCVIVIGLPYANITAPDLKAKMSYLDKIEGMGAGKLFYENLCIKAVNQSIGRAVRHKQDYATILLVDERFNRASTKNALPGWIKRSLRVWDFEEAFQYIDKFFQSRKSS